MGLPPSGPKSTLSPLSIDLPDLPRRPAYRLRLGYPSPSVAALLHPRITPQTRYRNINLFPIDYAFRPRLRGRLTLGGLPWPRKPWASGGKVSHFSVATYASMSSCRTSSMPHDTPSQATTILAYHSFESIASVQCLAPLHLPRKST